MKNTSLGLIETRGMVPAIAAADAASKAAMVSVLGYEITRAGLVTIKIVGDVAAVKAAVTAGAAAAGQVGEVISSHMIPRPASQLWTIQPSPEGPQTSKESAPPGTVPLRDEGPTEPSQVSEEKKLLLTHGDAGQSLDPSDPQKPDKKPPKPKKRAAAPKTSPKGRDKSKPR